MYKMLVVDDEALERTALKKTLERRYGAQCAVSVAANGQEAIALSERLRADIVLMDIEMPGISGLEAARIIKQMLPRCRIIILTAYQRFQYAQQAIAIGADDYLLKPVSDEELIGKIDEAMAEVQRDLCNLERNMQLDQLAKEQFVLSVISGYSDEASLHSQLKELRIPFSYGYFMAMKGETVKSAEKLAQMASPFLGMYERGSLLTYEWDELLLIAVLMGDEYRGTQHMLDQAAAFARQVERAHGVRLRLGVGDGASTLWELRASYELAGIAIGRTTGQVRVMMGAGQPSDTREGLEARLYQLLLDKDLGGAMQLIDIALDALTFGLARPKEAVDSMERLLGGVLARLGEDTRMAEAARPDFRAFREGEATRMEWTMGVRALLEGWIREVELRQGPHIQTVRHEIERYMQQHYSEDLSIGRAAGEMHYSQAYFSKLFTRCFQRNFLSYLTELRLGMAVEMMANPQVSIREIGIAVGYADSNYFAKVFRKAYGLSPSDFRRKRMARKEAET